MSACKRAEWEMCAVRVIVSSTNALRCNLGVASFHLDTPLAEDKTDWKHFGERPEARLPRKTISPMRHVRPEKAVLPHQ